MTMIITVTPTIMDGTTVRWYRPDTPLDALRVQDALISASRNGVYVQGYLDSITDEALAAARDVHEQLKRNPAADVAHLATHRKGRGLLAPYEPIEKPQ